MPRYFFDVIQNGHAGLADEDGIELPDDDAAWAEATGSCGQMIRDLDGALPTNSEWRMDVANADGSVVFRLHFRAERPVSTGTRERRNG
jgi:hypothetical protein